MNITIAKASSAKLTISLITVNSSGEETMKLQAFERTASGSIRAQLEANVQALTIGLANLERTPGSRIVLHTDSDYVLSNYKKAMFEWPNAGWKDKHSGNPIKTVTFGGTS